MTDAPNVHPFQSGSSSHEVQQLYSELESLRLRLNVYESQNRLWLEAIPQMVWTADCKGTITYFNRHWYEYTGFSQEASQGLGFLAAWHPQDRDRSFNRWQQSLKQQQACEITLRILGKDGTYRWFVLRTAPVRSPAGELLEWIGTYTDIDQSKRTEAELEKEQEFLKALLANLSDGIVACDAEGVLTLFNQASQEFHGLPVNSIPAEAWAAYYDLYHADGQTLMQTQDVPLFRALNGELVRNMEMMVIPKQGQPRTLLASGNAILSSEGQKLGAVVAMRDITERQRAEQALNRRERELSALLDNTPDIVIRCDRDFRYVYVSPSVERNTGVPRADLLGKTSQELGASAELCDLWSQTLQRVFDTGQEQVIEFEAPSVRGMRHYQSRVAPELDPAGGVQYALIVSRDITELKQAETEIRNLNAVLEQRVTERTAQLEAANRSKDELLLREQTARTQAEAAQRRYQDLVNGLSHAIVWEADAQTNQFSFVSQTAEQILGYAPEQWLADVNLWPQLIHPEDREWAVNFCHQETAQGRDHEFEYRCIAADGRVVWMRDRVYLVRNQAGQVEKLRGLMVDITEAKQAEAALRTRAAELAQTTTLLVRTTTVLEKRNQELDQFAYVISHDLKAPLRAIANLSQWLEEDLEDKLTQETRHQMNLLRGRVHRMEALIDGLLQYSRVGRIKVKPEMVAVETLLAEVIDSLAPSPGFQVTVEPGMPRFLAERLPLAQVFANLISNALKHHHRSEGQVRISVQDQGKFYEFAVADDGPGIPASYHEKVFVIFQTLEARDKVENTGIGLSLVKKIVEDQRGTIRLQSDAGQGTTLRFTWPKQPIH